MSEKDNNLSDKTAFVYDFGIFFPICFNLAKKFKKVLYFTPWASSFPTSNDSLPGFGFEKDNIFRVDNLEDYIDVADIFIFPDVYNGHLQVDLERRGKRVWGSRMSEELEIYRSFAKEVMSDLKLPVGKYDKVKSIKKLREYLQKNSNKFIKIDGHQRGDFESFNHISYDISESWLDEMEWKLGVKGDIMEFIIEDPIEADTEIGIDSFVVDGEYPKNILWGIETKSQAYVGAIQSYDKLPKEITNFTDKIKDTLKEYGTRGNFSFEFRNEFMIDACMRLPNPPGKLLSAMWENMAECMWAGSEGKIIEPVYKGKYGAELVIYSDFAKNHWVTIHYPKELKEFVFQSNVCKINDKIYVIPQTYGSVNVGSVVAYGDDLDKVIEEVKERAKQIEGYKIDCNPDCIDDSVEQLKKLI